LAAAKTPLAPKSNNLILSGSDTEEAETKAVKAAAKKGPEATKSVAKKASAKSGMAFSWT
jgi:hypothetical protein